MKAAILSQKRTLYSTRRLIEECKARGIEPVVLNPLRCDILVSNNGHSLFYNKKRLNAVDVVIPRIGSSITHYGLSVLRYFSEMGIPSVAEWGSIAVARDKFHSLQVLSAAGVQVPATIMIRNPANISKAIDRIGGVPVIVKLIRGTQGIGVIILESKQSATSAVEALWQMGRHILIQEYIIESRGVDIRAIVVDGKVVASCRRFARLGEFRSNIHQGAVGELVELHPEYREIAERAAHILNLGVAGIDMVESVKGIMILEVNASPGFEGIEKITHINVAGAIIDYAKQLVAHHHFQTERNCVHTER
jgi:ribosomal protein S6--L-glutamate ligase